MVTRPIASHEPRAFAVMCDPTEFSEVMEIPVRMLSPKKYETHISVDVIGPGGQAIIAPGSQILAQRVFNGSVPQLLVTLFTTPSARAP
jgi:hypothetical protein